MLIKEDALQSGIDYEMHWNSLNDKGNDNAYGGEMFRSSIFFQLERNSSSIVVDGEPPTLTQQIESNNSVRVFR